MTQYQTGKNPTTRRKKKQPRNSNGLNNHVSRRDCKLSFHKRYKLSYQQNFLIEKKDEEWVFQYHDLLK